MPAWSVLITPQILKKKKYFFPGATPSLTPHKKKGRDGEVASPELSGSAPFPPASLPARGVLSPLSSLLQGKGKEETYWLVGKAGFPRPLPTPLNIKPG